MEKSQNLKRTLGLAALVAYGVGNTLGAGIYALVGKVAGTVGAACWMSFAVALLAAAFTALSYAELGSRFPFAAGEAHYTYEACRGRLFSHTIGFLVFMTGINSMCTVAHAFAGYLSPVFPNLPIPVIVITFFTVIGIITLSGMENSSRTNMICTLVEVSGLLIVIAAGAIHFSKAKVDYLSFLPGLTGIAKAQAVISASIFAFYAFIGFEDMVKASEEVKDPEKNLPKGILMTVAITGVVYILVALSAVTILDPLTLKNSTAPLMDVVQKGLPKIPIWVFTIIALFAVANTALVNFMMASRILYGMAHDNLVPAFFGKVHSKFKTPHVATAFVFALAVILTLTGNLTRLAQSTAVMLLGVFFSVNLSLLILKFRKASSAGPIFTAPLWAPVLGLLSSFALVFFASLPAVLIALTLLGLSFVLYLFNYLLKQAASKRG